MAKHLFDLVGNTPLLEISHPRSAETKLYAKAEYFNPGGSVKDRPVRSILQDALRRGWIGQNLSKQMLARSLGSSNIAQHAHKNQSPQLPQTLIDATSGNTGIAYAMLGASIGLDIELALPENASEERKQILQLYGAKLHYTSPLEGTDGAQKYVAQLVQEQSDRYYYPDQYNNDNNWMSHHETTGPEIWEQSQGRVTHFCAGIGTSGTFVGTSRFLKTKDVYCVEVLPDNPMHGLEGWKHLDTAIVPGIYDATLADERRSVSTEDAFAYAIAASRYLGLLLSPSSAANLYVALHLAQTLKEGSVVVTIFPDNAMKYLKDRFWSNHDYIIPNPFK